MLLLLCLRVVGILKSCVLNNQTYGNMTGVALFAQTSFLRPSSKPWKQNLAYKGKIPVPYAHKSSRHTHPAYFHSDVLLENRNASANAPFCRDTKLARLEAALFCADRAFTARKLAQIASLPDGNAVRTLVEQLNQLYDQQGTAYRIEQVASGYRLYTRKIFYDPISRHFSPSNKIELSSAALETLTIVAHRQPVLRAEVESIRGVQCGAMLRHLLEKGLIRIAGRDASLGRPLLYATTRKFLEQFGLKDLNSLEF